MYTYIYAYICIGVKGFEGYHAEHNSVRERAHHAIEHGGQRHVDVCSEVEGLGIMVYGVRHGIQGCGLVVHFHFRSVSVEG